MAAAILLPKRQWGRTMSRWHQLQQQLQGTQGVLCYYREQAALPHSLFVQMILGREEIGNHYCATALKYFSCVGKELLPLQKV